MLDVGVVAEGVPPRADSFADDVDAAIATAFDFYRIERLAPESRRAIDSAVAVYVDDCVSDGVDAWPVDERRLFAWVLANVRGLLGRKHAKQVAVAQKVLGRLDVHRDGSRRRCWSAAHAKVVLRSLMLVFDVAGSSVRAQRALAGLNGLLSDLEREAPARWGRRCLDLSHVSAMVRDLDAPVSHAARDFCAAALSAAGVPWARIERVVWTDVDFDESTVAVRNPDGSVSRLLTVADLGSAAAPFWWMLRLLRDRVTAFDRVERVAASMRRRQQGRRRRVESQLVERPSQVSVSGQPVRRGMGAQVRRRGRPVGVPVGDRPVFTRWGAPGEAAVTRKFLAEGAQRLIGEAVALDPAVAGEFANDLAAAQERLVRDERPRLRDGEVWRLLTRATFARERAVRERDCALLCLGYWSAARRDALSRLAWDGVDFSIERAAVVTLLRKGDPCRVVPTEDVDGTGDESGEPGVDGLGSAAAAKVDGLSEKSRVLQAARDGGELDLKAYLAAPGVRRPGFGESHTLTPRTYRVEVPVLSENRHVCPVRRLLAYRQTLARTVGAGAVDGVTEAGRRVAVPVFVQSERGELTALPMSGDAINRLVVRVACSAGIEGNVGAHSLRVGLITDKIQDGASWGEITAVTGHRRQSTVMIYYRPGSPRALHLTTLTALKRRRKLARGSSL